MEPMALKEIIAVRRKVFADKIQNSRVLFWFYSALAVNAEKRLPTICLSRGVSYIVSYDFASEQSSRRYADSAEHIDHIQPLQKVPE